MAGAVYAQLGVSPDFRRLMPSATGMICSLPIGYAWNAYDIANLLANTFGGDTSSKSAEIGRAAGGGRG